MSERITMVNVKRLFMALHGMYGNVVIDKFKTGELDAEGLDRGIASMQSMWLNGLSQFDAETVKLAIARCADRHQTFPPTLPEFRALCLSLQPRRQPTEAPRIGMSDEMRSKAAENTRRILADLRVSQSGQGRFQRGLPGLIAMCASAHGSAGGDEPSMLMRLEARMKE